MIESDRFFRKIELWLWWILYLLYYFWSYT